MLLLALLVWTVRIGFIAFIFWGVYAIFFRRKK